MPRHSAPLDACADPALAHLQSGPPKFPMYWKYLQGKAPLTKISAETGTPGPQIICQDARTQISALALFLAHARVAKVRGA